MAVHDGHRARRKKQFLEHGLDTFADHEVLELLLFYAVPRVDTNPIAHRLMERFGSFDAVLAAPVEELQTVEGVGENAAVLLSLILPLVRRARTASVTQPIILTSTRALGAYFTSLFFGLREERLYEACLDAKGKLLRCFLVAAGSADTVNFSVRRLVENALKCGASAVALSHNHPSGIALPSDNDLMSTLLAYDALKAVGIELIDHIVVSDDDYISFHQSGKLPPC